MGGQLSGAVVGSALAMAAAVCSLAAGLSVSRGGVLLLLLSVLVATRWCGRTAGYAATVTGAAMSLLWLAAAGAPTVDPGGDAAALLLLGLIGSGIATWTGKRPRRSQQPPVDPRRVKEEFLATVSHELRTPLNAILGWTELLRMRRTAPPQQVDRGLEVIERNARRQLALVEELLAAAEPGSLPQDWRHLDVREMCDSVLHAVEPGATTARVALVMDEPDGAMPAPAAEPVSVRGDAPSLRLALRHVLDNAIRYTPDGGQVRLRLRQCGTQVLIFVSDTGGGIEAARLDEVFEPFNQADGSAARRFGGLGLGLTIARKVVERHGGHVDLRSDGAGGGSIVLVTLPAATPADAS